MAKDDDDGMEASPSTPGKRKASSTEKDNVNSGPAKRTPIGGPRAATQGDKRAPAQNTPPTRKASANLNKTPNSAPTRPRPITKRGNEPTLLGDFLLGRPSPGRKSIRAARRKSLDAVKAEMRINNVQQMQQPGKVQERVKQWQKSNAKAGDPIHDKDLDEIVVEYETESEVEVRPRKPSPKPRRSRTPEPRLKMADVEPKGPSPRPGRRKDRDDEDHLQPEKGRSKSVAPKKRVISDEHWMKNRTKTPPAKGSPIPKNFLQATATNPPVERKIEDWVKRMADPEPPEKVESPKRKVRQAESEVSDETPRSRKTSRQTPRRSRDRLRPSRSPSPGSSIHIKPDKDRTSSEPRRTPFKPSPNNDGIRITPSKADEPARKTPSKSVPYDDGIRITPSPAEDDRAQPSDEASVKSEIQVKRTRTDTRRRAKEENDTPTPTPRKKSEHLAPPTEAESRSRKTSYTTTVHDDDATTYMSPSPSKRRNRKSDVAESLDEIPFGNSAFSVLDMPLGAEANTMRRPEPKRNNSFAAVPKALKRVYTEGMKRVHDTEPPRGGPNQPPSIEKWLNGTTDPFIDQPPPTNASLPVPEEPVSRVPSPKVEDRKERQHVVEEVKQQRRVSRVDKDDILSTPTKHDNRETLPSMGGSLHISPLGLKRTGATRITSSPKSAKKFGLKSAIFDAFKGESAMAKTAIPTPFDFIGLREEPIRDSMAEPSVTTTEDDFEPEPPRSTPRASDKSHHEPVTTKPAREAPVYAKRPPPVSGGHSLSTIASVTSYSNSSSASFSTASGSDLSHTTVTQDTVLSGTTGSSLSRGSKLSTSKQDRPTLQVPSAVPTKQPSLKRRLTKHADLVSMLSLPDTTQPGRSQSMRSARSIRTTRTHLESATVEDLLREIKEDEVKYMRELNTLVDGVIPVLLTSVLSKSVSAVAAGLFEPLAYSSTIDPATNFTKPIVDMGVALERMKSLHKRISLVDPDSFLHWAQQATKIYEDYLRAWRSGFEDVVVNLAPASRKASWSGEQDPDKMPVDANGDVIGEAGERVDVAYLLKAPHRRIKLLTRASKGMIMQRPTALAQEVHDKLGQLNEYKRKRAKEEMARREDMKANMTDTTRARDPKTLELADETKIDRSRRVAMKDIFEFDMSHSNGQRMECQIEVIFREPAKETADDNSTLSDFLICESVDGKNCLLFPPILSNQISARKGDTDKELVIMIRSSYGQASWSELFILEADDSEIITDWLEVLPLAPCPGIIIRKNMELDPETASIVSAPGVNLRSVAGSLKEKIPTEIPIGQRSRRHQEKTPQRLASIAESKSPELPHMKREGPMASAIKRLTGTDYIETLSDDHVFELVDVQAALAKAGHNKVRRFKTEHGPKVPDLQWARQDPGMLPLATSALSAQCLQFVGRVAIDEPQTADLGTITYPKVRSPVLDRNSTPLKESMRPDSGIILKDRPASPRDDGAPPPPAHTLPVTPPALKNIPVIDSPTPRVRRRGSSPLKHEYQPSTISGHTSTEEESFSGSETESTSTGTYSDSVYDDSTEEYDEFEDEHDDVPRSLPTHSALHGKKISPPASLYSNHNSTIAPSHSASQAPVVQPEKSTTAHEDSFSFTALVTYWNAKHGRWDPVHEDACRIIVGAGWLEAYEEDRDLQIPITDESTDSLITPAVAVWNPLVHQELTPLVHVRRSNAIDVQIRSQASERSKFKKSDQFQYRLISNMHCFDFYNAIHWSRLNNLKYNKLSGERIQNYGQSMNTAYDQAVRGSGRNWFSRRRSFRRGANGEATSDNLSSPSGGSSGVSALKRFSGGGIFNIGKSSVSRIPGGTVGSTHSSSSYSNMSPPETPGGGSQAQSGSLYSRGTTVRNLGTTDLAIMLYFRVSGQWAPYGPAFLTVSEPQHGQIQASNLNHGPRKLVSVRLKGDKWEGGRVVINDVLGRDDFSRGGSTGIYVTIWRDIVDEQGRVGVMPKFGGLTGKTEKWCFQCPRAGDCEWIWLLLRSGAA